MYAELESWTSGWQGLRLNLRPPEIQRLIELLQYLQRDADQHFHISSNYSGQPGLGDIEIAVAAQSDSDNMWLSGLAIEPDANPPSAEA